MTNASLQCTCGQVAGEAVDVGYAKGTRVVCYCDDCQAFARYLGNESAVLDSWGGTDIYQTAQSKLHVTRGADQIRCVRLSDKGIWRWYCGCCRTPIGNTLGPGMPFIGIIHSFFADQARADQDLGPVRGTVFTQYASGDLPPALRNAGTPYLLLLRAVWKILTWKLRGMDQPSPFFDAAGKPVSEPGILATRPEP